MRKGQIEIMGLVIIVILIVIIAIFALSFMIKPKQESEDFLKLKANALRASLLKTNLCGSVSVKDEIENCIEDYNECGDCGNLQGEIVKIIQGSLESEKYSLVVLTNGEDFIRIGDCDEGITSVSQTLRNGEVKAALCR